MTYTLLEFAGHLKGAEIDDDVVVVAVTPLQRDQLIEAIHRSSEQAGAGWQPIETAPTVGTFLVYLPGEHRKLQVMYRNERGITVIGGAFGFDLTKPTLWKAIDPPSDAVESAEASK